MRFYSFTNWMLRPIQQGIQPGHAAVELFVKYPEESFTTESEMLFEWARDHKTFICLNGGTHFDLLDLREFMEKEGPPYPWSLFCEDGASLGGLITSIGIILPPRIYETAAVLRRYRGQEPFFSENNRGWGAFVVWEDGTSAYLDFSSWEKEMIERLNACGLAT